jgi:maltose/moltooligosaccharide transporter
MAVDKPELSTATLVNMSVANIGTAIGFALQQGNMSRIFQTLGANLDTLPILMIAGPVTGLIVQPLVGHYSDRSWGRFGRRRPFFFIGALLAAFALIAMPYAKALWMAVILLWLLDAALNVAIEPFRAFMSDMTPLSQRTKALALNGALGCIGAVIGFFLPSAFAALDFANTAPAGEIPPSVRFALAMAGVLMFAAVCWTVFTTREYSREEFERFDGASFTEEAAVLVRSDRGRIWLGAGLALSGLCFALDGDIRLYIITLGIAAFGVLVMVNRQFQTSGTLAHILSDLAQMPGAMRRLAMVQFFTWSALFVMWTFMTPVITRYAFGATDAASAAYNQGADWTNILYVGFNLTTTFFGMLALPRLAARLGNDKVHALCLGIGALSFGLIMALRDPLLLFLPFAGLGIAWASILTMPYAILTHAVPAQKFGVYLGIFNFFITLPQIVVGALMGPLLARLFPAEPIWTMAIAAGLIAIAAALMLALRPSAAT